MAAMTEFDLLTSPLENVNLIEASAGTGKTYTITGLVLRLILEADVALNEILVVTYTEAATSELRDRIRRRLREAAEVFAGTPSGDPFLQQLAEIHQDHVASVNKLNFALNDFDQASIFTIHGFCMRTLQDHAFASGILFDSELVTNQDRLLAEIIQDFWRRTFYQASPLFYNYTRSSKISLASLRSLINTNAFNPYLKIIPAGFIPPDYGTPEAEFQRQFKAVRQSWEKARGEVVDLLSTHPGLKKNIIRPASVPGWIKSMDAHFSGECLSCLPCDCFDKFRASTLQKATKKAATAPSHPFFDLCDALAEARQNLTTVYDQHLVKLRLDFLKAVRRELNSRKEQKNILYFDDLLVRLEGALAGAGGEHLAGLIRGRFKAALIDEFQDTDSIQYSIFDKVFGKGGASLFLIGDPKQAIYGFRGADIFAYLQASQSASQSFTLSSNWRSEPNLIEAVNTVFANPPSRSFLFEGIDFLKACPPHGKDYALLQIEDSLEPPLQIWCLNSSELADNAKPIAKTKVRPTIAAAVAGEISRLINLGRSNRAHIGDRPLQEGDIAVLVRMNLEANLVQEALAKLGIHAVLYNMGSLFDTHEALELERLLAAVANPGDEALLRTALVTDLLGVSGVELDRLLRDEDGWERWLVKFSDYHDQWASYGFFRMLRHLLAREEVLPRLMSFADGERRCTNLLHLSETLHQSASDNRFNMLDLLKWLTAQRNARDATPEEHQLRLESDENAVKLVTIHKSKGLEYPVVFCPFSWEGSELRDEFFVFHDAADGNRLSYDLGSADRNQHAALAEREQLAENLRLFYVAMTRARHRCYLVWGRISGAGSSAPGYLLHPTVAQSWDGSLQSMVDRFERLDDAAIREDLERLANQAEGMIAVSAMPTATGDVQAMAAGGAGGLSCRHFGGRIDRVWGISSFSSLVSNQQHRADLADRDEALLPSTVVATEAQEAGRAEPEQVPDMFSLPKGAATGLLLHEIFEHLEFATREPAAVAELVAEKLHGHGFDTRWREPVTKMVRNVLAVRLESDFGSFSLAQVQGHERLSELEFYFPLQRTSASALKEIFSHHVGLAYDGNLSNLSSVNLDRLRFEPLDGYMKGFIDLVFQFNDRFYIVDWKSNFLGTSLEDYNQAALQKAMADNFYNLQYTLYTLALHQYLRTRLPNYSYASHFGEIYYIFLRGIDPQTGPAYGVYRDRPAEDSIRALALKLMGR